MKYKPILLLLGLGLSGGLNAQLSFDQNVTPDVIFGSGNANGGFTVVQSNGVELGLRAKLRFNEAGSPENTFNSLGNGTYVFANKAAPGSSSRPIWNFEWSINTDYEGTFKDVLNDFVYSLSVDNDPASGFFGENFVTFDPINVNFADHAIGNNSTVGNTGAVASDSTEYADLISVNNVAQNSWSPHWFTSFDPKAKGEYTILLEAFLKSSTGSADARVAATEIAVSVVPEPSAVAGISLGAVGVLLWIRRRITRSV